MKRLFAALLFVALTPTTSHASDDTSVTGIYVARDAVSAVEYHIIEKRDNSLLVVARRYYNGMEPSVSVIGAREGNMLIIGRYICSVISEGLGCKHDGKRVLFRKASEATFGLVVGKLIVGE